MSKCLAVECKTVVALGMKDCCMQGCHASFIECCEWQCCTRYHSRPKVTQQPAVTQPPYHPCHGRPPQDPSTWFVGEAMACMQVVSNQRRRLHLQVPQLLQTEKTSPLDAALKTSLELLVAVAAESEMLLDPPCPLISLIPVVSPLCAVLCCAVLCCAVLCYGLKYCAKSPAQSSVFAILVLHRWLLIIWQGLFRAEPPAQGALLEGTAPSSCHICRPITCFTKRLCFALTKTTPGTCYLS